MEAAVAGVYAAEQEFFLSKKNETHLTTEVMLADMRTFLEPIFQENGWRQPVPGRHSILLQHSSANGDFIMTTPFIRELRKNFINSHITLMVPKSCRDLAEICPYVNEVFIIPEKTYRGKCWQDIFAGLLECMPRLLAQHYDLGFTWNEGANVIEKLWLYLAGVRERVGYGPYFFEGAELKTEARLWYDTLTLEVPRDGNVSLRESENYLHILETVLKREVTNRKLEVWTNEEDEKAALSAIRELKVRGYGRIYALMPGASEARRRWPKERWKNLAGLILQKEPRIAFVILGGYQEMESAKWLERELNKLFPRRICSVAGKLSFRGTAALLKYCCKYLGNDTGALHMAVAQKIPVLVPYAYPLELGMRTLSAPVRFAPFGVPAVQVFPQKCRDDCNELAGNGCSRVNETHCILGIEVETMLRAYEQLDIQIAKKCMTPIRMY